VRHASGFKGLVVYQKARRVTEIVFELSKAFPREETYSLTSQIRRSSRSVGAQIAEAWAKRRYERHFISKLTDADAEQHETRHWVDTAKTCGYLDEEQATDRLGKLREIGRMLNAMIDKAALFCKGRAGGVHEEVAEYFAEPD